MLNFKVIMKKIAFLSLVWVLVLACSEVPIEIERPDDGGDGPDLTELETQPRIVMVDEFTGVACVQCPDGSEFLEELLAIYDQQLVVVAIHGGFFSRPFAESVMDLKVPDGVALINLFTEPAGYPAALINRKQFDDTPDFHVFKEDWALRIVQELDVEPIVAIGLEAERISETQLRVNVELLQREAIVPEGLRLSIGITESDIIEPQKRDGVGTVLDYAHQHVLRDMFTSFNGDPIDDQLSNGVLTELSFTYDIPEGVVIEKAEIFAAVHTISPDLTIYQANKAKIKTN